MFGFGKDPDNLKDDEIKIPSEWAPPEESSAIRRSVGDTALGLLKGGFGIGEALVGNADLIPTPEGKFGAAGKAVEKIGSMVGFEKPFEQIRTDINSYLSPETIRSMDEVSAEAALREREFTQATGFQDKALAAITGIPKVIGKGIMNPAGAWQVILESLPSMAVGARMATNVFKKSVGKEALEGLEKGFLAKGMATKEAKEAAEDAIGRRAVAIGAAGETGVTLGQNLESVRQQTEGGYLDARQTAIQTVSAMLTGGISGLSGRLAQRMGHADADTFLTGIINGELGRKHVNIFKKLLYSALREGALEEMPQSLQEQISQNLALGKPIEEGTFEATALGFLSGVGQSSMVNISSDVLSAMRYQSDPTKQKIDKGMDELKAGSREVSEAMGGDTGSKLGGIADILKKVTETTAPSVVLERPGARAEDVPDFQEEQLVQHKTKSGNDYLIDIGNNRVYADVKGQKGEEVFKHKKKAILDGYANREALQAEEKRKNTEKLQKNRDREIKIEAEKAAKAQKVQAKQDEFNSHIETLKTLGGYSDKDIAGYDLPKARKEVEKIKVTPFQKVKLKEIGLSDDDINRIPTRKMADEALKAHKNKVAKEEALAKAQADAEKKAKRISNKFEKEAKKPISVDISSSLYTYLAKTGVKLGDYSDKVKNKMGQSVDLSRQLSEDANNLARENGKPLDRIADELSDHFKRTITEDDVYQWIVSGKTKEIPMESGVTKAAQKKLTEAINVAETTQRDLENQARNDLGKYGVKPEQSSRVRKIAENFNGDPDTERGKADLYQIYQAEGLLEPAQKMGFVSKSQTPSKAPLLQGTSAIQWVKQKQAEAETERANLIKSGGGSVNAKDLEKIKNKITVLKAAIIGEGENAKLSPAVTDLYGDEARSKVELSGKIPEKINPEVAADVASGFKKLVPVREAEKEKTASVDELFENNKDLVGKILNSKSAAGVMSQINRGKLEREVANQVGAMALVEAAQKWDRVRDFRKYASGIILGRLMNETRGSSLQDRFIHSYITEISNDLESKNKRKPTNEEILVGLNIKLAEKQKDAEKRGKNKGLQGMKPLTMDHLEKYLASTADHESFEEEGDEDKVPTKIGGVAQKSPQKKLEEKDSGNFTRQNIINAMTYLNDLELDIALNEFFTEDRYKKTDEQLASRHNVNRLVVQRLRPKTKDGRIIEKGKVLDKIEARLGQPANEYAKGTIVAKIKIKVAKTWEGNILGLPLPQQDAEAIGESTGEGYTYKTKDKILRDVTSIKDKTLTDEDIRVLETAINGRVMGEEFELANTIPFLSTVPWVQGKKNSKDPAEKRLFDDSLRRLKATIETDIEMADVPGKKYRNIEWRGEKYPQFIRTSDGILIFENGEYTDHPTRESLEEAGIDPKYITSGYWRAATDSERETALNKISDVSENAEEFLVKELPRYRFEGDHRTMFIGTMSETQIARLAKMNIQNLSKEQYAKIIRRLDKLNEERTKAAVGENRKGWNYSIPEIRARQRRSVEIQRLKFNFDHTILPSLSAAIQGGKEGIRWDESGYQNKSFRRAYERARQDGYELIPIRSGYVNAFIDPKSKQIFCEIGQTIDALNLVGHELSHAGSEGHASNEETQKQINQRSPAVIAYAEKLSAIHNNRKPIEGQKPLPMWYVLKEYAADLQGGILENYGIKLHDGLNMNAQIDYIVNPFTQVAQEEKESERTLSSHGLALNLIETHDKKSMTAVDAIVEIEKTTETEFPFNELADYMQRFGIRISYDSSQMGNSNLDAEYSPEENTIFIGKLSNYAQDLLMAGAAADKRLYSAIAHQGVLGIIEQSMIAKGRYLQDTMNLKRAMKDFVGDIEASLNEAPENVQKKYRAMMENSKNNLSVIAHGMTNKDFAQWLNSLPDYSANAIRPESFWTRLKKIILKYIGRVTKEKTKLDRLNEILDEHAGIGFAIPSAVRTEAEVETRIRELEDYFLEDARKYPDEVAYIGDKTTILKEQYPATTDKQKEKYVDYLKIIWAASQNRELIASEDQHKQIKARYGGDIEERRRQWLAFSNELLENEKQRLARKALQLRTTAAPVSPFLYGMKIVPETKVVPSGEYSLEPTPKVKTTEEVLGINDQAAMDILFGFAGARGATVAQRGSTISVTGINIPAEGMIRQADKPLGESKETGKLSIMDDKGRQIGSLEITPMADGYRVSNLSLNKPKMVPDVVKYLFTANKNIDKLERDFSDAEIKANSKSVKAEAAMWEKLYSSKFAAGPVALTRDRFNQYLLDQKEAAIEKIENAPKLTAEQRAAKYALAKEEEESRKAREAEIERRKGLPPEEQARLAAEDRLISARYTEAAKIIAKADDRWESALQAALEFLDPVEFDEVSRLIKKPKKKMTKAAGKYLRIAKLLEWLAETEDRNRVTSLSAKEFDEVELKMEKTLLLRTISKNIINNDLPNTIANETIQNALDSFGDNISNGNSKIFITVDSAIAYDQPPLTRRERANNVKKRNYFTQYGEQARAVLDALDKGPDGIYETIVTVADNGSGMSPEDVSEKLLNLGSEGKAGTTTRGGFGLAKAAFLLAPRRTTIITTKDGITTTVEGTKESFFGIGEKPKRTKEKTGGPSGTIFKMSFFEHKKDADADEAFELDYQQAGRIFQKYLRNLHTRGLEVHLKTPYNTYNWDHYGIFGMEELEQVYSPISLNVLGNDIDIYFVPDDNPSMFEFRGYYSPHSNIFTKGLPLFGITAPTGKIATIPDFQIYIDFKKTLDVRSKYYPFINNRTTLVPDVRRAIEAAIAERLESINDSNFKEKVNTFTEMISSSPDIEGIKVLIPFKDNAEFKGASDIIKKYKEVFKRLSQLYKKFQENIDRIGGKKLTLAVTVDSSVYGYRSNPKVTGHEFYAINPFVVTEKYLQSDGSLSSPETPFKYVDDVRIKEILDELGDFQTMSSNFVHTMVHEYTHDQVQDHYETYTIQLARNYSKLTHQKLAELEEETRRFYYDHIRDIIEIQRNMYNLGKGGSEFQQNNSKIYSSGRRYPAGEGERGVNEERSAKEVKFSAKDVDRMEYVGIAKNTNDKIIDALNNLVNPKKKEKLPPGIAKRRVTGKDDPKTGEKKLYHPAITIQEFKLLKAIKDLRSGRIYDRPLTGWLENPIRTFEELGTDIKELFYRPMKVGENNAKKEFSAMFSELQEMLKPYSWWQRSKVSRRIGIYAIAKQEGGSEVLKAMNITNIPQLTAHEMKIYEWMRGKFEKQYELLQEARALAGENGFGKVEDYFTFARQFGVMEKLGFSPIFSKEFIHLKTTHFGFEKGRVGGLHKADLDAFGVFGRYMESATRHVALSPAIAKGREMVGLFDDGVDSEGEPITWMLADKAPTAARFITEWLDFQAGQRKIQLPPLIETGLRALNRNLAYATLAANVRSALIQPAALSNTVTAIGPKWAIVGIRSLMDKTAIDKSNVLRARQFDINVAEMMGGWFGRVAQVRESAGNWGIKGLQNLDMLTARATWHGAYQKGLSEGMKEIDAINYADDIVTKTQGSAMPSDLSPAQRTALGKAITMFQTFTINQWGFLTKDVLGINNKNVSRRDAGIKIFTFIGMALLLNWIYEDIFGLPTPLPSPIKAFIKSLEAGEDIPSASVEAALEVTSLLPIIGGGLRYGQSPFGAPYEYMADLFKKASSGPYKGPEKPWLELIAKGAGVPGTAQSSKMYRVHKKGGSVTDIILGRYETERDPSKIKENLTEALRKKKPGTNAEIQKQYRAGKLTSRDVQGIQRDARIDPRLVKFKALSLEKAIQEYSDASKEERRLYMSAFIKKREAINNYAPGTEQRKELQKKYRKALNG